MVGLSSCSSSSTTPIELIMRSGDGSLEVISGEAERIVPDMSERARIGTLVGIAGVVTVPLARLTVLIWLSSILALLNILAAASELENRAGNDGRMWVELLKNKGDGGCALLMEGPAKSKRPRMCLQGCWSRGLLRKGSESAWFAVLSESCRFLGFGGVRGHW